MLPIKLDLPADFLDEEVRCEYTVTSEMKEVWAVELDLLNELLRVCEKHGIRIFASGGTLLGAIRHKGFIPWDDDIDVAMFRADYQRLCEVAAEAFQHPYFFQTEYTDPGSLRGHAQLRNSLTTGILCSEYRNRFGFNQGIFIDIFPMDAVVAEETLLNLQARQAAKCRKWARRLRRLSTPAQCNETGNIKDNIIRGLVPITGPLIRNLRLEEKVFSLFENICQRYNRLDTELVSTLSFQFVDKKHYKNRHDYDEILWTDFEFIRIPICKNYDNVLRKRYGDYRRLIRGASLHGQVIFDANVSYQKYINGEEEKYAAD